MQHAHWPRFLALSLLSFTILFQYQNCAPGGKQTGAADANNDNGVVHAMGNSSAVQLSSSVVRLSATQTEASVSGTCVEAGAATLTWALRDPETGEDLDEGSTACVNNAFNMQLAANSNIECNKVYDLKVNDAEGTVTKDCQD